ncbi:MAG: peroxiredoxin [Nocardioidaceae bacterium]
MSIETGQEARDFTLKDQHGRDVTLSSYRGSRAVVVMFYPFAFSGVCTGELCALRDSLPSFENDDVALLAISCDAMFALRAFSEHDRLTYPLLSDFWPHGDVAKAYDVFDAKRGCALRGTFIVDKAGLVRWKVENGLPDARDLEDYRRELQKVAA